MIIKYSKQAEKFLKKQNKVTQKRIIYAIEQIPNGDIKRLKGVVYYRLRVGDFRILFDKDGNIIYVLKIDSRGDVYK